MDATADADLLSSFGGVSEQFASLGQSLAPLVDVADKLRSGFDGLVSAVASLNQAIKNISGGGSGGVSPAKAPPKIDKAGEDGSEDKDKKKKKGKKKKNDGGMSDMSAAMGEIGLVIAAEQKAADLVVNGANMISEKFAGGIDYAVNAILGPIQQLAASVAPFVEALNPSMMFVFNQAMRDVQATIGVALVPVIQVLTNSLRNIGGIILPIMESMAPVMRDLTRAFMGIFETLVRLGSDILAEVMPAFEFLASAMAIYSDALQAAWAGYRALVPVLMDVLKVFVPILGLKETGGVLASFKDAMHMLVESILSFIAQIAKAFGSIEIIRQMQENLHNLANPKRGMKAAPQDVQFRGFEDISKTMAQAAFAAQGTGANDKSEKEWLERLALSLDEIKNDKKDVKQLVTEGLTEFWDRTARPWLGNLPNTIGEAAGRAVRDVLPRFPRS